MLSRSIESSTSEDEGSGILKGKGSIIAIFVVMIALAISHVWDRDDDPDARIIDRVSDTVKPRGVPVPDCDQSSAATDLVRGIVKQMNKCCKDLLSRWGEQPEHAMPQEVIEAIAECSDVPVTPCDIDAPRLTKALEICNKGNAL